MVNIYDLYSKTMHLSIFDSILISIYNLKTNTAELRPTLRFVLNALASHDIRIIVLSDLIMIDFLYNYSRKVNDVVSSTRKMLFHSIWCIARNAIR